jgi:polysaccharide pyruvyl transferase WcaK-like protein
MHKLAIMDTNALANKGSYARLAGLLSALNQTLPSYEVTIFHRYFDVGTKDEIEGLKKYHSNFKIVRHPWYNQKRSIISTTLSFLFRFPCYALSQIVTRKNSVFSEFDAIIDLNLIEPDTFNDNKRIDIVNFLGQLFALTSIWNTSLSRKKIVICSATIGPYNHSVLEFLAKRILNNVDLITLREEFSRDYLKTIGITRPKIQLTADFAFLMETSCDAINKNYSNGTADDLKGKIVVGICPADMMNSNLREDQYIKLISGLSNHLIRESDANILFIANTFQDISLVDKIFRATGNPVNTRVIPFSASATDIKSTIGICNLFICSRFHALVASTSMGTPSIGLVSYSYNKFHGIIGKMMKQDQYLLDIDTRFNYDSFLNELILKSDYLLKNGKSVRSELIAQCDLTKQDALLNAQLIRDLISAGSSEEK